MLQLPFKNVNKSFETDTIKNLSRKSNEDGRRSNQDDVFKQNDNDRDENRSERINQIFESEPNQQHRTEIDRIENERSILEANNQQQREIFNDLLAKYKTIESLVKNKLGKNLESRF